MQQEEAARAVHESKQIGSETVAGRVQKHNPFAFTAGGKEQMREQLIKDHMEGKRMIAREATAHMGGGGSNSRRAGGGDLRKSRTMGMQPTAANIAHSQAAGAGNPRGRLSQARMTSAKQWALKARSSMAKHNKGGGLGKNHDREADKSPSPSNDRDDRSNKPAFMQQTKSTARKDVSAPKGGHESERIGFRGEGFRV